MLIERVQSFNPGKAPMLLDLSLWYAWHSKQDSLPSQWSGLDQLQIAKRLGAPGWQQIKPWSASYTGVTVETQVADGEKTVRYVVGEGTLSTTWTRGPDGDWWQMDHLISTPADFKTALALADALTYKVDAGKHNPSAHASSSILAIELPRRPLSALLHDFLGWGEGLLMLRDYEAEVESLLELLDDKLQGLVEDLCRLPGATMISPDNLDGQYISPDLFEQYLAHSYRKTRKLLKQAGKELVVHVGGPMRHIVSLLEEAGVDVIEGVSGPPQSDLPLDQARQLAGPQLTLWGGIPQDWLLEATAIKAFEHGVERVLETVLRDGNAILGVADRVPVAAEMDRLQRLQTMIENFTG